MAKHRWRLEGIGYLARLYCERCGKYHSEACEKEPCSTTARSNTSLRELVNGTQTKTKSLPTKYDLGFAVGIVAVVVLGVLWFLYN